MTLRKQIAAFMSLVFAAGTAGAQDLKSGPYKLPYKNTYVKEVFVAENEFRTAKPRTHQTPDVRRGAQDPALARVGRA